MAHGFNIDHHEPIGLDLSVKRLPIVQEPNPVIHNVLNREVQPAPYEPKTSPFSIYNLLARPQQPYPMINFRPIYSPRFIWDYASSSSGASLSSGSSAGSVSPQAPVNPNVLMRKDVNAVNKGVTKKLQVYGIRQEDGEWKTNISSKTGRVKHSGKCPTCAKEFQDIESAARHHKICGTRHHGHALPRCPFCRESQAQFRQRYI